jgi:hypothetical protein
MFLNGHDGLREMVMGALTNFMAFLLEKWRVEVRMPLYDACVLHRFVICPCSIFDQ